MAIDIAERVFGIVAETIGRADISSDSDLLVSGVIDSFDIINIIDALEAALNVRIPADAIVPENFGTVSDMVRLVTAQLAQ